MKNTFKLLAVAILGCGLMFASCGKDDPDPTNDNGQNTENGGGNTGGGNTGGGNTGGSETRATASFTWDGASINVSSITCQLQEQNAGTVLYLNAADSTYTQQQQNFVVLPQFRLMIVRMNGQDNFDLYGQGTHAWSKEMMSDAAHEAMFTEKEEQGTSIIYHFKSHDYEYLSHTTTSATYDAEKNLFSGELTVTFYSLYDVNANGATPETAAHKTLTLKVTNQPVTPYGN